MDNLSNLYNVIKSFLPFANQYLSNSPLEPYIPQIQNIVNTIDTMGGIDTLTSIFNNFKTQNIVKKTNNDDNTYTDQQIIYSSDYTPIDSYRRIN